MGIATRLRGREREEAIRAHRLSQYCRAYFGILAGTHTLEYLNLRINKLAECGVDVGIKVKVRGKNEN